jgi:hypothetical protein
LAQLIGLFLSQIAQPETGQSGVKYLFRVMYIGMARQPKCSTRAYFGGSKSFCFFM